YYAISVWEWKVIEIKFIDASIDGLAHFVNKIGVRFRPIQSGNLSSSLRLMTFGLILGLVLDLVVSVLNGR
ncbi:NADH-quinone oxidoreductase subunit L, partial [Malaciobacter molluscorum LMG 25693]